MPTSRRKFLKQSFIGGSLLALGQFPLDAFADQSTEKLTILHTNDMHSWLFPFPSDDKKFSGQGGVAARSALIKSIRSKERNVLLFDAGDIFQGTPYFNMFKGEPEIKAMSMMQYDAATMGNHEFDLGLEGFLKQLPHANFPFLTANYDFSSTPLAGMTHEYCIFKKGSIKIGVFGLGVQLNGLVSREGYGDTLYIDPIEKARHISTFLKHRKHCDLVVCLSHLGFEYSFKKVSDKILASETADIDVIIGGHTHTFLDVPFIQKNKIGKEVVINQVGWAGLRLGRLDFIFDTKKNAKLTKSNTVIIGK